MAVWAIGCRPITLCPPVNADYLVHPYRVQRGTVVAGYLIFLNFFRHTTWWISDSYWIILQCGRSWSGGSRSTAVWVMFLQIQLWKRIWPRPERCFQRESVGRFRAQKEEVAGWLRTEVLRSSVLNCLYRLNSEFTGVKASSMHSDCRLLWAER